MLSIHRFDDTIKIYKQWIVYIVKKDKPNESNEK